MRRFLIGVCAISLSMNAAMAEAASADDTATLNRMADEVLTLIEAGKSREAVAASLGKSPLFSGRVADSESLASQIDSSIRIYGAARRHELVKEEAIGTMLVRRHYIVQHDKMLTRWEFNMAKLPAGWAVVYFGFEDQLRTWER